MEISAVKEPESKVDIEGIVTTAIQIPGVRVNRIAFLAETFANKSSDELQAIISTDPITAGCSQVELKKYAMALINKRTLQSSGASFVTGLPGGVAMAATIPADTLQFFGMALRMAQEISYLYGAEDIWRDGTVDDERVRNSLILYCGVMFGVSGSSAAVKVLSSAVAKQALKKLPQKTLTKTVYYPIIKKTIGLIGVKLTKDTFAKGVSKVIPVVGGVVSGGITFASMRPMGTRLANTLDEANFSYTEKDAEKDITALYCGDNVEETVSIAEDSMVTPAPSFADELRECKALVDEGILTEEEFLEIKSKLIQEIGSK